LRSCLQVDVVEHWFDSSNYGIKLVPLGSGVLLQHIELRFDPPTVVYKHYKVPSRKETTLALTLTRVYLPFNSLATLSAHPVSFAFSSQSCSRTRRSWPSSADCSTSTTVITKNMVVQQYKAYSPIYRTCFLLRCTFELLGFLFQLRGGTRQLFRLAPQLLGCSRQLFRQDPPPSSILVPARWIQQGLAHVGPFGCFSP